MKIVSRRVLSILLAAVLLFGVFAAAPLTAYAAADNPYKDPQHAYGDCGDPTPSDISYSIFDDGSIAFFGTGKIASYPPNTDAIATPTAPWYSLPNAVLPALNSTKIGIEEGITEIGDYDFYLPTAYENYNRILNIDLPSTLTAIGAYAFKNQTNLEKIAIPQNVVTIGNGAFDGCSNLSHIDLFCDPETLTLNADFDHPVTIHVRYAYAERFITAYETANGVTLNEEQKYYKALDYLDYLSDTVFSGKENITFYANLFDNPYDNESRNIKAYMGQEHSKIFGGAAPVIITGTYGTKKKTITYANNGFATVVKVGSSYYVHSNNNSKDINLASLNGTTGIVESLGDAHSDLKLSIEFEYVGSEIVKVIYRLENTGTDTIEDVMLGASGDIKIGADDRASIKPLNDSSGQIGFYMTSGKVFDSSDGTNYATLGFIGKNVAGSDDNATFYYGEAAANKTASATGTYMHRLIPDRIFDTGTLNNDAQTSGDYAAGKDAGMSFYWDVDEIAPSETKQYAVLYSVYGNDTSGITDTAQSMVDAFRSVTWRNADGSVLLAQTVAYSAMPSYPYADPTLAPDADYRYEFSGWSPAIVSCTEDAVYTATYTPYPRLFAKHSLTLEGDIGVNFYLDPTAVVMDGVDPDTLMSEIKSGAKKITVNFSWYDKTAQYNSYTVRLDAENSYKTIGGKEYLKATCRVAAAEMAYNIHAVAYISDNSAALGTKYTKEYDDYSVKQYGDKILSLTDEELTALEVTKPTELKDLAAKMLDYGAKAQVDFSRTTDSSGKAIPLANADVAGYTMAAHTIEGEEPDLTAGLDPFGLKYYATSLVFLTETTLRIYYQVLDAEKFESTTLTINGQSADFVRYSDNLYYVQVANIPAAKLNKKQSFTFTNGSDESSYEYSAIDFAVKLQNRYAPGSSRHNLATAFYHYNTAAIAYFGEV